MTGSVQVETVQAGALTPEQVALWREMLAANPDLASPYFRPEFTQIAARFSPEAAVAVFRRDGRIIGFFPHQRRGGAIQPLGAPMNDYHGMIARREDALGAEVVARLLNPGRFSVSGWVGHAESGIERETFMTTLPDGGFAAWYAERRRNYKKYFKDKERARRSMEVEFGPLRIEKGLRDPVLLEQLIALKRDQYRRTARHDVFACGWTVQLLHALMTDATEDFGASMAALWAGDTLMAIEYSLHAGDHYHFWFPAYQPRLARCSPGILLSLNTMDLAGAEGFRTFDFGFGGEYYKKYFCNTVRMVRETVVVRPGLAAGISQAAVGALNLAGAGRGERLRTSVRRRWAAIEACETTPGARLMGAVSAVQAAAGKLGARKPAGHAA